MNKKLSAMLPVLLVVLVAAILFVIGGSGSKGRQKVTVGYVMNGSSQDTGWNSMHYKGVQEACKELGVELKVEENIIEGTGACGPAVEKLVKEGAELIFLGSYNYTSECMDNIKAHPEIAFFANSFENHEKNLSSYFVRMYQPRYLAGIVAAMESESGRIGYVAAMSNNEVNRGISAFTLGVRSVNPEAKVILRWTGEWDNKEKEEKAAEELIQDQKVDLITYHQNQAHVAELAEKMGVKSIGYHVAMEDFSSDYLTAVVCDWKLTYQEMIKAYLQGKANERAVYWLGMEEGVVDLSPFSEEVSEEARKKVEETKEKIASGWNVFSGDIKDQQGVQKCNEGENLSDEQLLEHFDWLVEGVEEYE